MEQLVIGAVRGKPTTSGSRTGHFRSRERAQTPMPLCDSDSNSGESSQVPESGSDATRETDFEREIEDLSSFEGNDSSTEMALIAQSFEQVTHQPQTTAPTGTSQFDATESGTETTGMSMSSQDATLSEVG